MTGYGWKNCFCFASVALLLRNAKMVFRKTKICQFYQPHLSFSKPLKLGQLRARFLENYSLTLYYLSKDFILLSSSSHFPPPLIFLHSPLSVVLPVPFYLSLLPFNVPLVLQWVAGWREDKGRKAGCCNGALSSSLCVAVVSQWRHGE